MTEREQHVVVVGCGRTGAGLAHRLVDRDHTVTVIDQSARAFRRLRDLDVDRVVGVGFDRDTLIEAGIERAVALGAVTNGDNTNIVVARTARERFAVPRVFARIYDPRRAAIYERLGVSTIAATSVTTEMALQRVLPDSDGLQWTDPSARVSVVERLVPGSVTGRRLMELEQHMGARVVAVRRLGVSVLPDADLVAQDGDVLYLAVATDQLSDLDDRLGGAASHVGDHR